MTPTRVLFTGSRTYDDHHMVDVVLSGLRMAVWNDAPDDGPPAFLDVAHGKARGLDELVDQVIPVNSNVRVHRYPAIWNICDRTHPKVPCPDDLGKHRRTRAGDTSWPVKGYCPLGGLRRNQDMLDHFNPDLVVAFLDKTYDSSRGTKDMCERAAKAGIHIHIVTTGGRP